MELDTKVEEEFSKVTEKHWIKYYRHVQKIRKRVRAALDDCCLVSDDDEDDVDDGGDAGDEAYCSSGNDDADDQVVIYSF
ncbi:hypothetical protein PI124_g5620 [Phytophthora idaei]|nr:hypothetical protein PI125_g4708 [Phytophthora idaei]KAG3169879.1 hypothetical protein PI126_g2585 [Phytophthora idaei]KAG3249720.1 hypothetical protein PI124_g5620 [Phytophthora idaei]